MSTIKVDTIKNTSNVEVFTCKAWVNFDGTQTAGNMIRGSGNVTSITDNGTGNYTVNFATAMADANYQVSMSSVSYFSTNLSTFAFIRAGSSATTANQKTTTQLNVMYGSNVGTYYDCAEMNIAIFR